jgi:hypothetical protein
MWDEQALQKSLQKKKDDEEREAEEEKAQTSPFLKRQLDRKKRQAEKDAAAELQRQIEEMSRVGARRTPQYYVFCCWMPPCKAMAVKCARPPPEEQRRERPADG